MEFNRRFFGFGALRFYRTMNRFFVFLGLVLSYLLNTSSVYADSTLLPTAKSKWLNGDTQGVISLVEPWTKNKTPPYGNERDALRLLLAEAYIKEQKWELAAKQLTIVRYNKNTLSKYATFKEPWVKFQAKEYWSTIKRCENIRQNYANSVEATDCLKLIGMAYGELQHIRSSQSFFNKYLEAVPDSPHRESLQLLQAEYTFRKIPTEGTKLLYGLFFHHQYPTTDVKVQEIYGKTFPITNLNERLYRIYSLIRGNRLEEAWTLFEEIKNIEEPTSEQEAWVTNNLRNISWRTRTFDAYLELVEGVYKEEKTSENAYRIFRAYCKAGMWEEAATFGKESLDHFGRVGRWAGARDEISRSMMFAKKYDEAAELWGKQRGQAAKFYKGFSLYMGGHYEDAISQLLPLTKYSNGWDAASNYWIGRSEEKLERDPTAYFATAKSLDSSGWYDQLINQRLGEINHPEEAEVISRMGQWYNERHPNEFMSLPIHKPKPVSVLRMKKDDSICEPYTKREIYQSFSWQKYTGPVHSQLNSIIQLSSKQYDIPDPYQYEVLGDENMLAKTFNWVVENHSDAFPNIKETQLLVKMGLYPEAARNMQTNYHHWEQGRKGNLEAIVNEQMLGIDFNTNMWRNLFLYTRSHHYVLRYTTNMEQYFEDPELIQQVLQINHPLVRPRDMWMLTEQYNVDPWLMLGLMRQESAYRETVRSSVGAIGYIQVMPATGAKLAFLLKDASYSPKDLEDPQTNLRYGIYYFSKLMERFDYSFPLAVGSYNGGPHNMSRWYRDRMGTWEMDEFVEHIPYDETRRYIKKVTGHYAKYVEVYLAPDHQVVIPVAPSKDDPTVINF